MIFISSIEIEGFSELEELLQDMTVTDADEKKAMKLAIEPIYSEVYANAPEKKGGLKKGIKKQVKKDEFSTVGIIQLGVWYSMFNEFGTSQSKKNVGFFERSVNSTQNEAIRILGETLLDKK